MLERLSCRRVLSGHAASLASRRLTGLYWFNHVVWFVASSIVIPHLKIKPLQVHCVLFRVEQRTGYSLLPDFATYFFQATKRVKAVMRGSKHFIILFAFEIYYFPLTQNCQYNCFKNICSLTSTKFILLFQPLIISDMTTSTQKSRDMNVSTCCIICTVVTFYSTILTCSK